MTGRELRGCWEPKREAAHLNVLSKVLDDAERLRAARVPLPAYQMSDEPAPRDFVPVVPTESAAAAAEAPVAPLADPAESLAAPDAPPAFVIEPDAGWTDRTSLFGDPES